jgi:hypothetical protein
MHIEIVRDGKRIFLSGPKGWYRVAPTIQHLVEHELDAAYRGLTARKSGPKRVRRQAAKRK